MADSLKARARTSFEAELIRDLDLADPIRYIVDESSSDYISGLPHGTGSANRVWRKQLTLTPGTTSDFNLRLGNYDPGPVNMLDGFGQIVSFHWVHFIRIKSTTLGGVDYADELEIHATGPQPWEQFFRNGLAGAPTVTALHFIGDSVLNVESTVGWPVDANPLIGCEFGISAPITNTGTHLTVDVTILGYHS